MAVAYVSDADATPATSSTITFTSFAVSGSNPAIVVTVAMDVSGGAATVSSVVCSAGLSGTGVIAKGATNGAGRVEVWAIPAPSGTGTITVTLSASKPWQANAILFSGAHQTTPCPTGDAVVTNGDGLGSFVLEATPTNLTANDAAVGAGANAQTGDNPSIDQSETFANNTTAVNMAAGYHLGTGLLGCAWTAVVTTDQLLVAARIAEATAGPGNLTAFVGEPITGSSSISN